MEKNFGIADLDSEHMSPLRIFSLGTKPDQRKEELNQQGDYVSSCSASPSGMVGKNQTFSSTWTEGDWAFRRGDAMEDLPSLEVRHEAMKRVFQSLNQNDGRTSRLETYQTHHDNKPLIGAFDKGENDKELYSKVQEAVERRVNENLTRLTTPDLGPFDIFNMSGDSKPKTAPPGDRVNGAEKQYYFPELRGLIEDRVKETKVDTLTNRLERELTRRQNVCNEQALMLQLLLSRVHDLEKRPQKRGTAGTNVDGWSRAPPRSNPGMYCYTSDYVVEKATQTPSDLHDAEGVYVMVARNSGAKAKRVQKRFMYGYPERVTEEKQVSSILDRKVVTRHIEFLPPIPDPFAKKRPRDGKRAGWHTM